MTTSLEWIADIAPDISSSVSEDKKNRFIIIAQNQVNSKAFSDSDTYNLAVSYLCCHFLALSLKSSDSVGSLVEESEGTLKRKYSQSIKGSETSGTQYLDMYNKLITNAIPNFFVSNGY